MYYLILIYSIGVGKEKKNREGETRRKRARGKKEEKKGRLGPFHPLYSAPHPSGGGGGKRKKKKKKPPWGKGRRRKEEGRLVRSPIFDSILTSYIVAGKGGGKRERRGFPCQRGEGEWERKKEDYPVSVFPHLFSSCPVLSIVR